MAHFKQLKPQLLSQENGILHVGRGSTTDSHDFGVVGEYNGTYSGFIRSSGDKGFHLFDSLASSPYAADTVNLADPSFKAATLNLGTLNGTAVSVINSTNANSTSITTTLDGNGVTTGGTVKGSTLSTASITIQGDTISTNDTNGNLTLAPNGTGQVIIGVNPLAQNSVATKSYVDSVVAGLDVKQSVRAANTADILTGATLAGSDDTKTITAGAPGAIPSADFDGVTLVQGDRVLVNSATADPSNGIYTVTALGDASNPWVLTRAPDANSDDTLTSGAFTFISEGTVYGDTGWVLSTADPITVDTTALHFTQFSSAGVIYATNVGTGTDIYMSQDGENLQFRSITGIANTGSNTSLAVETALSGDSKTVNIKFDQNKITGTGTLITGSIAYTSSSSNISTAGTVHGDTAVTSGGSVTAVNDITTTAGTVKGANVSATAGDVTASGNINTSSGTVSGATVTSSGDITTTTGAVKGASVAATVGDVTAVGNISTSTGTVTGLNVTATSTVQGATLQTATNGVSINDKTVTLTSGAAVALAAASTTALTFGATGATIATFDTSARQLSFPTGSKLVVTDAPTLDTQVPNKGYVDTAIAAAEVMGHNEGSGQAIFDSTNSSGRDVYFKSLGVANTAVGAAALSIASTGTDVTATFDQSQVTGTGALASGSIATGFGVIATSNGISGSSLAATGSVTGSSLATTDNSVSISSDTLAFANASSITMPASSTSALTISQGTNTFATFNTTAKTITFGQEVLLPDVITTADASGSQATTKTYVDNAITNATVNVTNLDTSAGAYNVYSNTTTGGANGPVLNFRALRLNDVTAADGTTLVHNTANPLEVVQTTNDITFGFDGTKITTVGALAAGSIASGFGTIVTTNAIEGQTLQSIGNTTVGMDLVFGTSTNYLDNSGNFYFGSGVTGSSWNIYDADHATSLFKVSQGGAISTKYQTIDDGTGIATLIELKTKGTNSTGTVDLKNNAVTFTDSGANQSSITYGTDFTIQDANGSSMYFSSTDITTDLGLVVGQGLRYSVKTITANKTVDATAFVWRIDASAGNVTVTLPAVDDTATSTTKGRNYRFTRVDSSSNTVTITPGGSDLLDGSVDNFALQSQYDHADVMCDGVSWYMF